MKVAVIGSSGMLGKMVWNYFGSFSNEFELIKPIRFDFKNSNNFLDSLSNADFVINCSGAIPQRMPNIISENQIVNYYKINHLIPELLIENNFKTIHPCTDCVYSGNPELAPYSLTSKYDCDDFYGRSKANLYLSEAYLNNSNSVKVIRSSVIGPDDLNKSLYSWVLLKTKSSELINGYLNHFWNGITTLKWAEIALNIIKDFDSYPSISVYGTNTISKYELIKNILKVNNFNPGKYLKAVKTKDTFNKSLIIGKNNFGDIYFLLKKLKNFNK